MAIIVIAALIVVCYVGWNTSTRRNNPVEFQDGG